MVKNILFLVFFLAVQCLEIGTAFLGYNYLQLVNDYRDRNVQQMNELQDALDVVTQHYFLDADRLQEIRRNVTAAQRQTFWCTQNLNRIETATFEWIGLDRTMDHCVSGVLASDEILAVVGKMEGIVHTQERFGSQYLLLKNDLETRLRNLRDGSRRFYPHAEAIEEELVGLIEIGTMITGLVLAVLIAGVWWKLVQLMRRMKAQNAELESASLRFDFAMNSIADGFALYDRDLRLVACNAHYRTLSTLTPDSIKPGMHVSDVLRNGAQTGIYPDVRNDEIEAFVSEKTDIMRDAEMTETNFVLAGDRHVRAMLTRSSLGDRVVVRTDITDFVRAHRAQLEHAESLTHANKEIRHKSLHDPLTDLPNRRMMDMELEAMLSKGPVTVIRIDLDRFKQVNDVLGHKAGDFVLCRVADLMRSEIREGDLPSRFGGDEFVVLCREGTTEDEARELAERLLARIVEPLMFEGKHCRFGASFGIASCQPGECDGGDLLSYADAALYAAKSAGRRTVETFSPALHEQYIEERMLGDEFATALEQGQIVPYFQTQHDAASQEIVGAEVLARWEHPRRGLLSPPAFLDVVRKLGMEGQLDEAIFDLSVKTLKDFAEHGVALPKTSFNISAGRLIDPNFVDTARRSLSGLDTRFAFEILESVSLENMDDDLFDVIEQMKNAGFEIEIDDFGSGHASIASVMDIAPHALKIDRRLVAPMLQSDRNTQMIASIVQLAEAVDIRVTAEGVETLAQAAALAQMGCDTLQGFYFSRPESAADLLLRLQEQKEAPKRGLRA